MQTKPTVAAIIVAAGRGLRAGGEVPKQWQQIAGKTVVEHTLDLFVANPQVNEIVLVIAADDHDRVRALGLDRVAEIAIGGADRSISVQNGVMAAKADRVLIHDAARCCCPSEVISRVCDALDDHQGAAPAMPVTDALWTGAEGKVTGVQDRTALYAAQTPQGFHREEILNAHQNNTHPVADDVEVARLAGLNVAIVQGDARNIKITMPEDFARAAKLLETPLDIRTGNGFDVHRFGNGDHVVLCGVKVPHDRGLQGHSDADVGMHTVTDAIYGALCRGDIGQHFPPSDPQWKGVESHVFLTHACDLAREMGFEITHMDCTLICEFPKIGPVAQSMRTRMAEIMGLDIDRVSVKATTSERLGFTGRGEGIAALATVTLVKGMTA
ncbi:bifunctional 2-C-methyl-D-erythritol 4-phosphate cytidylyltransferase/2-C-methyl-D-erythritol 2,4-cyclodiphosphate synthase [Octadecabacter ascidiaceicola]|uniref:Bifunctional enzyme IspD/IspF n=1 Tax=Octadecabacter ascidiaceicola TaxID=1655543 RepID=A0A238JLI8_9RHOB|nr:bifunctional 2-C-methyl-D-erythritol 4-phosphate cytidylyltransferase/2-C-methyl-D-erythritol 2,4-cyclodiphosphate synthase [Octadecabacter ascidiaceicola]SMX31273.1 Bifunctional enzyme IspD/IspF [Octadecabacter ascidiaceicola]